MAQGIGHWDDDPTYQASDWKEDVARDHTRLGYAEWVAQQRKMHEGEDEEDLDRFTNHYECPECGTTWSDNWSCACNDECPGCGLSDIEPHESTDHHADDCDCDDRSWHGDQHDSACPLAGQDR